MAIAYSKNGVPIRLTYERWYHITENHDDLASYYFDVLETIENPDFIIRGNKGTLKATRNFGKSKWLVVTKEFISKTPFSSFPRKRESRRSGCRIKSGMTNKASLCGFTNDRISIYREISKKDGFVITAYFLDKRPKGEIIWQQK